jgi:hypothetical protein
MIVRIFLIEEHKLELKNTYNPCNHKYKKKLKKAE